MVPVGAPIPNGTGPAQPPARVHLEGRTVKLVPLEVTHSPALYAAIAGPEHAELWDYMRTAPYTDAAVFEKHIANMTQSPGFIIFAVLDRQSGNALGLSGLINVDLANRVVENGHVIYSPQLQRSPATTETAYLLAKYAFEELGFRRYTWMANDLNLRSKRAAVRLGFTFEGVRRQDCIVKGRNRDTAMFSMLDGEWPMVKRGFERWLDPANFTADGVQIQTLEALREEE